jgi:hypothetical protein
MSKTSSSRTISRMSEVCARGGNPVAGSCLDAEVGASFYGRAGPCVTGDMSGCNAGSRRSVTPRACCS